MAECKKCEHCVHCKMCKYQLECGNFKLGNVCCMGAPGNLDGALSKRWTDKVAEKGCYGFKEVTDD